MSQKLKLTAVLLFLLVLNISAQTDSVIIKNNGNVLAEFKSSTKGILPPQLTTAARTGITSPEEGLLVYDTDLDQYCFYNGGSWTCGWIDGCETLDDGYDCGGAGVGRKITADAGAVWVNGSNTTGSTALLVDNTGTGSGVRVSDMLPDASGTETQVSLCQDGGVVGSFEVLGPGNAVDAIHSFTNGTGRAGFFENKLITNTADALEGQTLGLKNGVLGVTGVKNATVGTGFILANVPASGTLGISTTTEERRGASGVSIASDGVWGASFADGSRFQTVDDMDSIRAGVHGTMRTLNSTSASKDFFGVFGITENNGNGVLGIGGGSGHGVKGHGVMGISAWSTITTSTNAGVWGVTREGSSWDALRARFPLEETLKNKVQVGVLGQSENYVAAWGESLNKIGVVGTTTMRMSFDELPGFKAGGYMVADTAGFGAVGQSNSEDLADAGLRGIGKADKDKASALEIHNGAIRVTKTAAVANTPADKIVISGITWTEIKSCSSDCPDMPGTCVHEHVIGFEAGPFIITNIYADKIRSVVLLTVEFPGPGLGIHLEAVDDGFFAVDFTFHKPEGHCQGTPPPSDLGVHYLIINK